jgi:hypothetical protein
MLAEVKRYEEEQARIQQEAFEFYKEQLDYKVQAYEDSWRQMMDIANQIGGEAGMGLGQMMAGLKGITDIETGQDPFTQRMDVLRETYMKHLEDLNLISQQEVALWRQKERDKQQIEIESLLTLYGMENEVNNLRMQQELALNQQKMQMTLNTLSIIQGALAAFGAFSSKENKAAFLLSKAIGIAMIWVQTQIAAMSAAASLASIPYTGPALAAAAYAQMQVLGYISMAAAAAATIGQMAGGGGGRVSAPSGGGGYAYTSPTEPGWQQTEEKSKSQVINVNVYGNVVDHDAFARELVLSIKKATEDGVQ